MIDMNKLHALADLNRRCDAALRGSISVDSEARKKKEAELKRYEEASELIKIMDTDPIFARMISQAVEDGIKTKARKNALEIKKLLDKMSEADDADESNNGGEF